MLLSRGPGHFSGQELTLNWPTWFGQRRRIRPPGFFRQLLDLPVSLLRTNPNCPHRDCLLLMISGSRGSNQWQANSAATGAPSGHMCVICSSIRAGLSGTKWISPTVDSAGITMNSSRSVPTASLGRDVFGSTNPDHRRPTKRRCMSWSRHSTALLCTCNQRTGPSEAMTRIRMPGYGKRVDFCARSMNMQEKIRSPDQCILV